MVLLPLFVSVILNLRKVENIMILDVQKLKRWQTAGISLKKLFLLVISSKVHHRE